ncbi:P-loop NTPase fold protein [Micromonospora sp. WMMC264]|uniref:KAP family P-loop NTPase fold protein n=1 Tax=Micromonospora sp. WMMC264 TaxID=3015158 RepID=UPI00248D0BDD|nr:P-loop NTPase fold protein [Micromonospora sp. WMMC264]WBB83114.1 P-loop NTPase fold protein [Micromonospora sp. WMMC264]
MSSAADSSRASKRWRFFADDPIRNRSEDRLGREAFADQVAHVCEKIAEQSETSVLALIAPYGSGKSSMLSLVEQSVQSKQGWTVVSFNPWLFSDIGPLLNDFFAALNEAIGGAKGTKKLRRKLGGYAMSVAPYASLGAVLGLDPSKAVEAAGAAIRGDVTAEAQKRDLAEGLRAYGRRILVTIDDIDRLQPGELLLVLKLIRLTGRLPNVYYLLAYDERTVLDVIARSDLALDDERRARDYLEKIVQVRMDLPPLHEQKQGDLVWECLREILEEHDIPWSERANDALALRYESMAPYLRQPRAINRFFAQVDASFPLVSGEVDFLDFLTLTFLRTFESKVYENLYRQKAALTGSGVNLWDTLGASRERPEQTRQRWLDHFQSWGVPDDRKDLILRLLLNVFPVLANRIDRNQAGDGFYRDLQFARRAGSEEYFDRYFQYGVTEFDIADSVVIQALDEIAAGAEGESRSRLSSALQANPSLALSKLLSLAQQGSVDRPSEILIFLSGSNPFAGGSEAERRFDQEFAFRLLATELFIRMDPKKRSGTVDEMAKHIDLRFLVDLGLPRHGTNPCPDWFGPVHERVAARVTKYFEEISSSPLGNASDTTRYALRMWHVFKPSDDVRAWLWERIDEGSWSLMDILVALVGEAVVMGAGRSRTVIDTEFPEAALDVILGVDEILKRLGPLLGGPDAPVELDDFGRLTPSRQNKEAFVASSLRRIAANRQSQAGVGPDTMEAQTS